MSQVMLRRLETDLLIDKWDNHFRIDLETQLEQQILKEEVVATLAIILIFSWTPTTTWCFSTHLVNFILLVTAVISTRE